MEKVNGLWIDSAGRKTYFLFEGRAGYLIGQKVLGSAKLLSADGGAFNLEVDIPVVNTPAKVIIRVNSDDTITLISGAGREDLEFVRALNAEELAEMRENMAGADPLRGQDAVRPNPGGGKHAPGSFAGKEALDVFSDSAIVRDFKLKRFGDDGFETIRCIMGGALDPVEVVGERYVVGKAAAPPVCGEGLEWGLFVLDLQTGQSAMIFGQYDPTTEVALPEIVGADPMVLEWTKARFPELFEV